MNNSEFSLYILRCADNSLYTGIAVDVDRRMQQHSAGKLGAKYLRGRTPFKLVFQQVAGDRSLASRLEHRVKRLDKMQKQSLIKGRFSLLSLLDERSD